MKGNDDKAYNPNTWGLVTGVVSLAIFAIAYVTIGFPSMLIHVFMLPIIIGFIVRWQIKLKYTNPYRDD